jgi:2-polyprenyl-6-methoxyphenol hydroxylase-like FAD-dependent oxidoreductase
VAGRVRITLSFAFEKRKSPLSSKVSLLETRQGLTDRVVKGRIALLGDAADMANPHTGAGAYTVMVDAVVLREVIQEGTSMKDALQLYSLDTVRRGHQLMSSSRRVCSQFCPP